jgi:hypothetical protein
VIIQGTVQAVDQVQLGDYLLNAVSIGGTSLALSDTSDFDEAGGTLLMDDGAVLAYTSCDDDLDIVYLTVPLVAAYAAEAIVLVQPTATEWRAQVLLDDADEVGEPIVAVVSHALIPSMPEGIRSVADQESVVLDDSSGEWLVTNILGREPFVDGSFIDISSLPAAPTDGLAPSVSPPVTVVGMVGGFLLQVAPVANHDAVTYQFHVSTASGFTAGPTTMITEGPDTLVGTQRAPDGSAYAYFSTDGVTPLVYYFKSVAYDVDGAAAASVETSGSTKQASDTDIAELSVSKLTSGEITAAMILSGQFNLAGGGHIGDDGMFLPGPDGSNAVALVTDPAQNNLLKGDLVATSIDITDQLTLRGMNNRIMTSAKLGIAAGVGDPATPPAIAVDYAVVRQGDGTGDDGYFHYGLAWNSVAGKWLSSIAQGFGGSTISYLTSFDPSTGVESTWSTITTFHVRSITYLGGYVYALGLIPTGADAWKWWVWKIDATTGVKSGPGWEWGSWTSTLQPAADPAIGNDGTNLLVSRYRAGIGLNVQPYTTAGALTGTAVLYTTSNVRAVRGIVKVASGTGFGGARYIIQPAEADIDPVVLSTTTDDTSYPNEQWPRAYGATMHGVAHDGTNFFTLTDDNTIYRYETGNAFTTESPTWWAAYTWLDNNATGGTHESLMSTRKKFTMKKRARLTVIAGTLPATTGSTDDANAVRIWLSRGSVDTDAIGSSGANTSGAWLNGTPATGVLSQVVTTALFSGTAPPTSNNFPASTAGQIYDAASGYWKGSGDASLPRGVNYGRAFRLRAYRSAASASLTTSTYTVVILNVVDSGQDPLGMLDTATGLITIPTGLTGYWRVHLDIDFDANATGIRVVRVNRNSTTATTNALLLANTQAATVTSDAKVLATKDLLLTAGDVVRVWAWQNSGAGLVLNAAAGAPSITLDYLGT